MSNAGYYKLQSVGDVKMQLGLFTVTCGDVTIVSHSVAVNATTISAGALFGLSHVFFSKCSVGGLGVTVTTVGTWTVKANQRTATGPPELWSVSLSLGSAALEIVTEDCRVTLDLGQTITGEFNDADPPNVPNTQRSH